MQLPFDLAHRPALGRADFLIFPGNELAVAWIDRWPDWPGPALAIFGPAGCGKSHLAQAWQAVSGAATLDAAGLLDDDIPALVGETRVCLIDEADRLLATCRGPESERRLLHLYNMILERRGHLLLTGRSAPARWPCELPDLHSRLAAMPAVSIAGPDDALIEGLLVKLFADRQLRVGADVIRYLVPRLERSSAAARAVVAAIDGASLAARREITVPLVRAVLEREVATLADSDETREDDDGSGNQE